MSDSRPPEGCQSGLPPGFTAVKLPEVMTAMEALDVIKTKMARSNVVIIASWAHSRTCLQLIISERRNTMLISLPYLCPVLIQCTSDGKQNLVICLRQYYEDDHGDLLPYVHFVPTNSTQHRPCTHELQSSDVRPLTMYTRVCLTDSILGTVDNIVVVSLIVDDTWVVGVPEQLEFMLVAYSDTQVLVAVLPSRVVHDFMKKHETYALCFVLNDEEWKPGTGIKLDTGKDLHWAIADYTTDCKISLRNVNYQPPGDVFDKAFALKIHEDRLQIATHKQAAAQAAKAAKTGAKTAAKAAKAEQHRAVLEAIAKIEGKPPQAKGESDTSQQVVPRHVQLVRESSKLHRKNMEQRLDSEEEIVQHLPGKFQRKWFAFISHVLMQIDVEYLEAFFVHRRRFLQRKHYINTWGRFVQEQHLLQRKHYINAWGRFVQERKRVHFNWRELVQDLSRTLRETTKEAADTRKKLSDFMIQVGDQCMEAERQLRFQHMNNMSRRRTLQIAFRKLLAGCMYTRAIHLRNWEHFSFKLRRHTALLLVQQYKQLKASHKNLQALWARFTSKLRRNTALLLVQLYKQPATFCGPAHFNNWTWPSRTSSRK